MTHYTELHPSPWLCATDLEVGKTYTVTIDAVKHVEVFDRRTQQKVSKPAVYFVNAKKPLILNKTNAALIAEATGEEQVESWVGKKVLLYVDAVRVGRETRQAVRVRKSNGHSQQYEQEKLP